ncbi:MAG: glycosyl hydrolase [Candidatus Saccharicenans sp.]|nr:glycosyl hydrolase [Candidatus Saccharicenans sp.]
MRIFLIPFFVAGFLLTTSCRQPSTGSGSLAETFKLFSEPPSDYRPAPLWVWNEDMTPEKISAQLRDLKDKGFGGVFVHPRPGLITPYLSEEWLSLFKQTVSLGRELGLKVWIYDENSYPSGFAGGLVPAARPEFARSGLRATILKFPSLSGVKTPVCLLQQQGQEFLDITDRVRAGEKGWPEGRYWLFEVVQQEPSPWYGGFTYVDLMRPGVTQVFLHLTLDAYKKVAGEEFGLTVPGTFQDEAEIAPAGGAWAVNYTPALFSEFSRRRGYNLLPELPSLLEEVGDFQRVRHDFYLTCLELFVDNWARPYYEYCSQNNLQLTGHYWEHDWPVPRINPDNLALSAYAHMPGIDILMNEWSQDVQAQFGNARAVRELSSLANQLGRKRTLSETYGASGWDLTFFDQKRIGDWEYALGVNFLNQHLVYSTIAGARKRDHPLSFSYHEPWWPAYRLMNDYFGRLSVALSAGEQINRILVIEPTSSAWMYYSPAVKNENLFRIGQSFQDFVHALERLQVEYDLGSEFVLKEQGKLDGKKLRVGNRNYELVILPPGTENLEETTASLLRDYLRNGGRVLSWAGSLIYTGGRPSTLAEELAAHKGFKIMAGQAPDEKTFSGFLKNEIEFKNLTGRDRLFHHRRQLQDGQLLFLANINPDQAVSGQVILRGRAVEKWEAFTGRADSYPARIKRGRAAVDFSLKPGESLLLAVYYSRKSGWKPAVANKNGSVEILNLKPARVRRLDPNLLTLDYCDLSAAGRSEKNLYFYRAQQKTYQWHGWSKNPWDSGVQYQDEIISRNRFSPGTGFRADYHFQVAPGTDLKSLRLVVERPEIFRVLVNGRRLDPLPGEFWLDRNFGVFSLTEAVRTGLNTVSLVVNPFNLLAELEPIYVLGNFALQGAGRGFLVTPARELTTGSWKDQGLIFYGHRVAYETSLEVSQQELEQSDFIFRTGRFSGAVAELLVNGESAGYLLSPHDTLNITSRLRRGANELSLIIYGTLKNTLGPHHLNPPAGRAWPGSFQRAPEGGQPAGSEYNVLDYGLYDFLIIEKQQKGLRQ